MIKLYDKESRSQIGDLTPEQLQFLIDQLEEEDMEDRDYAITPLLLEIFEAEGADPELVSLLRDALGTNDTMLVEWVEPE